MSCVIEAKNCKTHPFSNLFGGDNAVSIFIEERAASLVHQFESALCSLSGRHKDVADLLWADQLASANVFTCGVANDALSIGSQRNVGAAGLKTPSQRESPVVA